MYISFDIRIGSNGNCYLWKVSSDLGTFVDKREITSKEKLPRVRWFERIVNYCLKNYIKEIIK